ncbi:MAG: hypothetical protein KJ950_16730 [Proteobacteria bacterium]|nr:hypothetical protein [Pseudomonadota bacterium]MBU1688128.1 hypothetical protein [Pseudomonadota bacterium]
MKTKGSYDFYLILATTVMLAAISGICLWGMFAFKFAGIHELAPAAKIAWQNRMNTLVAPFITGLIVLLGICVPKRLLPTSWLNRFAALLLILTFLTSWLFGVRIALLAILTASLALQLIVLVLAIKGSSYLHFEKKGYWARLGSTLIHLGLVLFVLDLYFHRYQTLHLALFWVTTAATVMGMIFCFYAESVVRLLTGSKDPANEESSSSS